MLSVAEATGSLGQTVEQMIPTLFTVLIRPLATLSLGVPV